MTSSSSSDDRSRHARCAVCKFAYWGTVVGLLLSLAAVAMPVRAENGRDAWLRYEHVDAKVTAEHYAQFPAVVVTLSESDLLASAQDELVRGVRRMLGPTLRVDTKLPKESAIVLARFDDAKKAFPMLETLPRLADDGYWIKSIPFDGQNYLLITGPNERGILYGAFALLRKVALAQPIASLNERQAPVAPLRMIGHWDQLDGAVARTNGRESIFWDDDYATKDLDRVRDYARLLASVGINAISINDPGAGPRLLKPGGRQELAKLDAVLRPCGVRLFIALNSTSPPVSPNGRKAKSDREAWDAHVAAIYKDLPNLGGFVVDADWAASESQDDPVAARVNAINTIAAAVKPHNGIVVCRTCVCGQPIDRDDRQPQDAKHDPAKVAYELFQPLDGKLDDNVVLQIKHGPMDFQVREPASPLLGALEKTNVSIEFQVTQRHLGQQRHLCFLVPMWKQALEFNMQAVDKKQTHVKEIVAGKTFERPIGGFVAVSNAGRTDNWMDHDLAMANLYGFGRLAWDPNLTGKPIAEEWARLTFGHDPLVVGTLVDMMLKSWRIYESYTGPLGAGTFTDVASSHFGPGIASSASSGWTPWHNADATGIGMDRTAATGSGFTAQYRPGVAKRFETLETCPDELILFMHRVPYTHTLKSGKTVIQHIYDSHYDGANDAARFVQQWESLKGRIDDERYAAVLKRLVFQGGHAQVWRDAVCNWFLDKSGIADGQGRVGNYPNRFEAESMQAQGYEAQAVSPWETASGGQCAVSVGSDNKGAVVLKYEGKAGWFNLNVRYFDESDGKSQFKLLVAGQPIDEWKADDTLPDDEPNGNTSTRREIRRVALRPGDEIRIETIADAGERAAIDYLEIDAAGK